MSLSWNNHQKDNLRNDEDEKEYQESIRSVPSTSPGNQGNSLDFVDSLDFAGHDDDVEIYSVVALSL